MTMLRAPHVRQRMIRSPASGSGDVVRARPQRVQLNCKAWEWRLRLLREVYRGGWIWQVFQRNGGDVGGHGNRHISATLFGSMPLYC